MAYNFRKEAFQIAEGIAKLWPSEKPIGSTELEAKRLYRTCMPPHLMDIDRDRDNLQNLDMHFFARWRSFGYPTFELTHSLAAMLLLTDCSGIQGRDFKFPFPSFLITLPYPNSPITAPLSENMLNEDVRFIYIHNTELDSENKKTTKCSIIIRGDKRSSKRVSCPYPNDDESIENWLASDLGEKEESDLETLGHMMSFEAISRLTANLCLYLDALQQDGQTLKREPTSSKKNRDPGPALPPAWILGRDIKLSPELRAAARQISNPKAKSCTAWQLQSQHIVRGHWKNQAYGPGRTLRKRIRIEPYWKGPRLSEAVLRSFTE